MTHSMPGLDPVPAPAQPWTDPQRFIIDALHVMSRHVTPSRRAPPHDARKRVMECAAPRGPCGFSYLPYRPPYCIKGPIEPRSEISLVIEYHCHEILPTPHSQLSTSLPFSLSLLATSPLPATEILDAKDESAQRPAC